MSVRFFEYRDLNVFTLELERWTYPAHNHNYYEIIFVDRGKGHHLVNGICLPYGKGDVFFLGPNDEHEFEIAKKSHFIFVKFTELLLVEKLNGFSNKKWQETFSQILNNPNRNPQSITNGRADTAYFLSLVNLLKAEYSRSYRYSRQIVVELFGVLLLCVGRNMVQHNKKSTVPNRDEEQVSRISAYLRKYLLENQKISIARIANEFNMSPNYISLFYKKHTGDSIRKFIINSKLKIAQQLLKHSKYTISEISHRLGFTDVSHFNKVFKKYNLKTPSVFRALNNVSSP